MDVTLAAPHPKRFAIKLKFAGDESIGLVRLSGQIAQIPSVHEGTRREYDQGYPMTVE